MPARSKGIELENQDQFAMKKIVRDDLSFEARKFDRPKEDNTNNVIRFRNIDSK